MSAAALLIGLGNELRGDDAAGLLVARAVRERAPRDLEVIELGGEPVDLIEAWEGAGLAVVADAVVAGGAPGEIHRIDAAAGPLPAAFGAASTHAFGLGEAVELGRALDRLPPCLVVFGIEGASFEVGAEPSAVVRAAAGRVAERLLRWPQFNRPQEAAPRCAWRYPARS